ncbi:unnamed protein product [Vicia faba]|uniref:Uncharacterized protein n=1 Tax=Vicia faba TaxID=3906 RepID=A0AAV0YS71_VICFA|nr:unnamed protein product [Vicia faba]
MLKDLVLIKYDKSKRTMMVSIRTFPATLFSNTWYFEYIEYSKNACPSNPSNFHASLWIRSNFRIQNFFLFEASNQTMRRSKYILSCDTSNNLISIDSQTNLSTTLDKKKFLLAFIYRNLDRNSFIFSFELLFFQNVLICLRNHVIEIPNQQYHESICLMLCF